MYIIQTRQHIFVPHFKAKSEGKKRAAVVKCEVSSATTSLRPPKHIHMTSGWSIRKGHSFMQV